MAGLGRKPSAYYAVGSVCRAGRRGRGCNDRFGRGRRAADRVAGRDHGGLHQRVVEIDSGRSAGAERSHNRAGERHQHAVDSAGDDEFLGYLGLLTRLIGGNKQKTTRRKAIAALSTLVGALSMARAVNDERLSREILISAADELKAQLM